MHYIAHRDEKTGRQQGISAHLQGTAELAGCFAAAFGARMQGYRCGMLHDIGMYSQGFQRRILQAGPAVDHSTAGALEAWKLRDVPAAFCIAGHHDGLPDGGCWTDAPGQNSLLGRMKRRPGEEIEYYDGFREEIKILPPLAETGPEPDSFSAAFYTRMLYSCLVDADLLDTERFMTGATPTEGGYAGIPELLDRMKRYFDPWRLAKDELGRQRLGVLHCCLEGGAQPGGLYTLTVPAGCGKMAGSLAFALQHAWQRGLSRVIYVLPYTGAIEQMQQVFSDIFGPEQVVAHYTDADWREGDGTFRRNRERLASENWDAPIILTTAGPFFESLFSDGASRCRKLHNIADSVVILDEAQMLPVPYLRPCVAAMGQLIERYGCTALLCTASSPALSFLFSELDSSLAVRELCPEALFGASRRVRYERLGLLTDGQLVQRLNGHSQVLCVVNSRRQVQEVFRQLSSEDAFCLSTLMVPAHRRTVLQEIQERLRLGRPCRVVSTCLIETGVDVDFPVVYRAPAGLDSVIQAGGRCNREGKRRAEESVVYLFGTEQKVPPLFAQNVAAAETALERYGDPASPEAVRTYFDLLLKRKGRETLDRKRIMDLFLCGENGSIFPFETVARRFCLTECPLRTVYLPLEGEGAELIGRLRAEGPSRSLLRSLEQYALAIYPGHFDALHASGDLEQTADGFAILRDLSRYDERTGLSLKGDEGKDLFV